MVNTNNLEGMRCPRCGSYGPVKIQATCVVEVEDDGTGDSTEFEWEDTSYCECMACTFNATVGDFKEPICVCENCKGRYPKSKLQHIFQTVKPGAVGRCPVCDHPCFPGEILV